MYCVIKRYKKFLTVGREKKMEESGRKGWRGRKELKKEHYIRGIDKLESGGA